jgi:hypothetical protein
MLLVMTEERYAIQNAVGRLLEARVFALTTPRDVDDYSRDIALQLMRMPRDVRPVLCADHRPVAIYPEAAADRLVELFTQMNTRLDRVAILVSRTNATLFMQLNRIVREANYNARRVVHTPEEAHAHLAPVLEPAELARMREFLAERAGGGVPSSRRIPLS